MESTAPRVVTTPVFDTKPPSLNGSAPKESAGFFASVKGFISRTFGAVKSFISRAFGVVKGFIARVTDRLPETVRRLGKPFLLLPLVAPQVWGVIGKAATWAWNHGPRQINNFLTKYVRQPIQSWVDSMSDNSIVRMIPAAVEFIGFWVAHRMLSRMGPLGVAASVVMTLLLTDVLKFASDFTDDNAFGQNVMAGTSLATISTMFIATLMGKNWSVLKALHILTLRVAPIGGYVQQLWFDMTEPMNLEEVVPEESTTEVSNEEMAERVAEDLRSDPAMSVTLAQSKLNLNPKGRREVWLVKGHDVDVDEVTGFHWKDGVGYDKANQPVAVDLRGDLTRATRDRRRGQFLAEWATAHSAAA